MHRALIVALALCLACFALPATALAQSAGDEQYEDPLGPPSGGGGGGGSTGGGNTGGGGNSGGSQGATPGASGAQSGGNGQAPSGGATAAASPSGTTAAAPADELPRTGFAAGVLALTGAALLGSGIGLRRRSSPRRDRAQ